MRAKKRIEDLILKSRPCKKPIYTMIRFEKRMDLLTFLEHRIRSLSTSKNAYLLALIEQDMEHTNEKAKG